MEEYRSRDSGTKEQVSSVPPVSGVRKRIANPRLAAGPVYGDMLTHDQYLTDEMNVDRLRMEARALHQLASRILEMPSLTPKRGRTAEAIYERARAEVRMIYSPLRGNDLNNRANIFERARIRLSRIVKYSAEA